jgi:4-amino-4-deoxychorismate lyase
MSWDSIDSALAKLRARQAPHWSNYVGFYSSWLDGYFQDPWAMTLPLDDHGFHRGDAVFEAVRIYARAYIDLDPHLQRLKRSADSIGLELPKALAQIRSICLELARRGNLEQGMLRLYVTRGPGDFSPNPKAVVGAQIYAALTQFKPMPEALYDKGCRALLSTVEPKSPFFSRIKSCNYLHNVLMKQECVAKGFDMALGLDTEGRVTEGSTENFVILSADNELLVPRFDYTLRGTTLLRVMELAEELQAKGQIAAVKLTDFTLTEVQRAREAAFVGTTLGVLPVASLDEQPIGLGGFAVMKSLHALYMARLASDPALRSPF